MFKPDDYAFQIEVTVSAIFNCKKYELGGIADANFIEKDPFIAIAIVLGNFYNKVDGNFKERIDEFLNKYYLEMGKSISEIGEEKIKNIIKDFNNIIATI
ncbi:MAG TPA: hypothetical protein DCG60_08145 [Tissierella sp.]|uniref:hypothetical protein n=1 Tax=Tissierella praeacuta TaxID=43131 RepID=UPI000EDF1112|nr:hypothetical protein [Tissierella praeacuta]HAE92594.1 hypothetical protein [Tissierella sp.]